MKNKEGWVIHKKYTITCPDCNVKREISYNSYRAVMTGNTSGRCIPCGYKKREKTKKDGVPKDVTITPIFESIEKNGCKLTETKQMFFSKRCIKYDRCAKSSGCLMATINEGWPGFTADCQGFRPKREFEV